MGTDKEIWATKVPESTGLSTTTGGKYEIGGQITQQYCPQVVNKNNRNYSHMQPDVEYPS